MRHDILRCFRVAGDRRIVRFVSCRGACSSRFGTDKSDYIDQQNLVSRLDSRATVHNNDYIGAASYNIFAGVFVATIFGAAFFFDLFWPERTESAAVRLAWKICSVLAIFFVGASAFELTVITATHSAFVSGVDVSRGEDLAGEFQKDGGAPLKYRKNARAVAAVVFLWPGFLFTIWR